MASIVLSSVGGSIGNALLPGLGGALIGYAGRRAGQWVDQQIGLTSGTSSDGARLSNLSVQDSRYGVGLPVVYGRTRVSGNVIWASDLIETVHQESTSVGKGGGSSESTKTTYTYSLHAAIAICAGLLKEIATIWADTKIIYQDGVWKSGVVDGATVYLGEENQSPDPLLETWIGSGSVPGYKGIAYIVLDNLQLANFGNRLPSLTFEIVANASEDGPAWLGDVNGGLFQNQTGFRSGQMPPLYFSSLAGAGPRVLVGGYAVQDSSICFQVVTFDVSGDVPAEDARVESSFFSSVNTGSLSWALSPDGRFIALSLYDGDTTSNYSAKVAIYDTIAGTFGDVLTIARANDLGASSIVWIDSLRFVYADKSGASLGVRVFSRAGLNVLDLGFSNVWGSAAYKLLGRAQFVPFDGGAVFVVSTIGTSVTLKYRSLSWSDGALVVGDSADLITNFSILSGSSVPCFFLQTGSGAWTFIMSGSSNIRLFSLTIAEGVCSVTRGAQILSVEAFEDLSAVYPVWLGAKIVVVAKTWSAATYMLSEILLSDGAFGMGQQNIAVTGQSLLCDYYALCQAGVGRIFLGGFSGVANNLGQCGLLRYSQLSDTLAHIVGDVLERAGFDTGDYDVSALADYSVPGYVLSDPMTAAAAIRPLQMVEPFDVVETGGRLVAKRHAATPVATIDASVLGAHNTSGEGQALPRMATRADDLTLPIELTVNYIDPARAYEIGTQRARRQVQAMATSIVKVDVPLVLSASRAKALAEQKLYKLWAEKESVSFALPSAWVVLDPGDVIDLGDCVVRINRVRYQNGTVKVDGVVIPRASAGSLTVAADTGGWGVPVMQDIVGTRFVLMDLPVLASSDNQPGLYFAAGGDSGWRGCTLWRARDTVNYSLLASAQQAACMGYAVTVLADASPHYWDQGQTLDVQVEGGILSSCTESELLNGANAALCGGEIIQFQTASLIGTGLYRLSRFLRGRLGTEGQTVNHTRGEPFVLLSADNVQFIPCSLTDRGQSAFFKAVSYGQTLGRARAMAATYGLATLKPYAPVHLTGLRAAGVGSDLTLRWVRRARLQASWVDYIDVPLDESAELYDLEIMNGLSVLRTFSNLSEPMVVYTAAMQVEDWGSTIPSSLTVRVYQRSDRYGRGEAGVAVL